MIFQWFTKSTDTILSKNAFAYNLFNISAIKKTMFSLILSTQSPTQ